MIRNSDLLFYGPPCSFVAWIDPTLSYIMLCHHYNVRN